MKNLFLLFVILLTLKAEIYKPFQNRLKELPMSVQNIVDKKATEMPWSGKYVKLKSDGIYHCIVCDAPLFKSNSKFDSHCGWPSFDDAIKGAVKEIPESDGIRTEIVCAKCGAHLGHVFRGEGFTPKNTRYCVNSLSLDFKPIKSDSKLSKAYFAGGCFWGVEYYMEQIRGVVSVVSGYMGGKVKNPSYKDVCRGDTGHYESVEVVYDPSKVSYEALVKRFFNIHDPTQAHGQGPDIGSQYRSAIFVSNESEKRVAKRLKDKLISLGYDVKTQILPVSKFYKAKNYHQDYYKRHQKKPYCHIYIDRFKKSDNISKY